MKLRIHFRSFTPHFSCFFMNPWDCIEIRAWLWVVILYFYGYGPVINLTSRYWFDEFIPYWVIHSILVLNYLINWPTIGYYLWILNWPWKRELIAIGLSIASSWTWALRNRLVVKMEILFFLTKVTKVKMEICLTSCLISYQNYLCIVLILIP